MILQRMTLKTQTKRGRKAQNRLPQSQTQKESVWNVLHWSGIASQGLHKSHLFTSHVNDDRLIPKVLSKQSLLDSSPIIKKSKYHKMFKKRQGLIAQDPLLGRVWITSNDFSPTIDTMIKHPKMVRDSSQCLGRKTRGVVTPQQLRLFVPYVYDMAHGPRLKDGNATLHVVLTSVPYRC